MGSVSDNTPLTPKQEEFCQQHHLLNNGRKAYLVAYPNSRKWDIKNVDVAASKLLALTKVSQRIAFLKHGAAKQVQLTVHGQIKKMGEITSLDPGELFDPDTKGLKPILDLPEHVRRAIASFEAVELPAKPGSNGKKRYKFKYKFWNKPKTVDMENKHIGFYEIDNAQKRPVIVIQAAAVAKVNKGG